MAKNTASQDEIKALIKSIVSEAQAAEWRDKVLKERADYEQALAANSLKQVDTRLKIVAGTKIVRVSR